MLLGPQDLHREFKGGRNADAVEKFVHKVIGPPVVALEDRDAAAAFAAKNDITFVLFPAGEGGAFESEYAELGKKYLDSLYLGSCADASLFPGLAVPEVPAVAVLNEGEAWQWHTPASEVSDFLRRSRSGWRATATADPGVRHCVCSTRWRSSSLRRSSRPWWRWSERISGISRMRASWCCSPLSTPAARRRTTT